MEERLNEGEEIFTHSGQEMHPSVRRKGQNIYESTSFDKKSLNFNKHMAHANYPFLLHPGDKGGSREWHLQNAPYVNLASAYDPTTGLSIRHPNGDRQSEIRPSNGERCMKKQISNIPMSNTSKSNTGMNNPPMNNPPMSNPPVNTSNMTVTNGGGLNPNDGNLYASMYSGGIPQKKERQKSYVGEDKNWSSKGGSLIPIRKNLSAAIFYRNGQHIDIDRMKNATLGRFFTPNSNAQYGEADNLMIHQSLINHVQQDGHVGEKAEVYTLLPRDNNSCDCLTSVLSNVPEGYIQNVPANYQMEWRCSNEWGGTQTQGVAPSGNNPNAQSNGISHLNSSTTSLPHNRCACPNFQFDKNGNSNLCGNRGHLHSDVHFSNHPTGNLVYHPDGSHIASRTDSIHLNRDMRKLPASEHLHVIPQKGCSGSNCSFHVTGEGINQMNHPNRTKSLFADQWSNEELLTKRGNTSTSNYRIRRKGDSPHGGESYEMGGSEYEPSGQRHLQERQHNLVSSEGCMYPNGFQVQTQLNPNGTLLMSTCGSFPIKAAIPEDGNFSAHMGSSRDCQPLSPQQGTIQLEKQMANCAVARNDNTYSRMKNPSTLNPIVHANEFTPIISDNMIGSSYSSFVNNPVQNWPHLGEEKFFPPKGNYCVSSIESSSPLNANQMGDSTGFIKMYNNSNTSGEDTEVSAYVNNLTGVYDMAQRSISSSSRQLSLLDVPNEVNNEQEETLQRQRMYDLYVQSLLNGASGVISGDGIISSGGVTNPNAQLGEKNDQLILFNLKNLRNKITKKAPQMTNNYLSYLDHYIASLRLLYNKLLSNRNLIFILAKEVFAPKKKRDKKTYNDDNESTFESKHLYVQELLAALLPQPPVFPPFEIWIYMGKRNASQLHKLHLTIYIIYQKIICNISNILLKINNDMVSYTSKSKFSKRNGTDSLNDYVNDNGDGLKRTGCPFLSATKEGEAPFGGPNRSEYVAKRGVQDRQGAVDVEDVDYLIEEDDAVEAVHSIDAPDSVSAVRAADDAVCIPVKSERATSYSSRPAHTNEDEPNLHKGDIPRKCLFRIDEKLAIMMTSIDNIRKMMNSAEGGRSNSSKDPSVNSPNGESKATDVMAPKLDHVGEDGDNNIQQDDKSGIGEEDRIGKHTNRISKGISLGGCPPPHISINPNDSQIVAYHELTGSDGRPLFERVPTFKSHYSNSIDKDSALKLLNELKYELRNVYNEIRSLKRHDSYYLSSGDNGEAGTSLELVNPNDDHGEDYAAVPSDLGAVSNRKIKTADETSLLNDFLYSQSESCNPLVNAHTRDYYPCASKKNGKKIKINLKKQNEILNSLINSNICSKEQVNKDIIYDLKYTDDIFKKLLFLCRNFYTNLSDYKDYALESFHQNEVDLTNLSEHNTFSYMENQPFFSKRPLLPSGELLPQEDFPAGKYQLEVSDSPLCDENGDVDSHTIEKVSGLPFKAEDHTLNVAPVMGSGDGDHGVNSGEETLLSDEQVGSTNCAEVANRANYARYTNLTGASLYNASDSSNPNSQDGLHGRSPSWVKLPMEKKEDKEGANQVDAFFAKFDGKEERIEAYGGETPQSAILQMGEMDSYAAGACTGRNGGVRYSPSFLKATNSNYAQMEVGFGNVAENGGENGVDCDANCGPDSNAVHASPETLFSNTQSALHYSYPNQQHGGDGYSDVRSLPFRDTSHVNSEHPYVERAPVSEGVAVSLDDPYVLVKNTEELTRQGKYMTNSYVQNDVRRAENCSYLLSNAQNVCYPNEENLPIDFENTEGLVRNDCAKYEQCLPNAYAVDTNGNMRSGDNFQRFNTPMARCLNADGSYVGGDVMANCLHVPHSPYHKNQPFGMSRCVGANGFAVRDTDSSNHNGINRNVCYYTDGSALPSMLNYQGAQNSFQNSTGENEMASDQFATNGATNNFMSVNDAGMINQFSFADEQAINMHRVDNLPQGTSTYRLIGQKNTFKDGLNEGENFTEKMYNHNGNYFNNINLRDTTEDVSDNETNSGGGNHILGEDENTFDGGSSYFLKNGLITNDMSSDHWKLTSNFANKLEGVKSESGNGEEMHVRSNGEKMNICNNGEHINICNNGEHMNVYNNREHMNVCNLKGGEMMRNNSPPEAHTSPESPNEYPNRTDDRRDHNLTNDANKIKLKKMLEITDKLIGKKYRGISYDPTRNGWSTFVYKDGVRRKKFFSSYKYGNLLAKKKSIEWRLKNLSPDSHAYVFSLKAKEEFNAILNDGYADINNVNCDSRDGGNDGDSSNNRDILYVNAFINLFNSSAGRKKDEPNGANGPNEPLCQMEKSSYEECAEELTREGTQDGSGPGSSELAKGLGEANYKDGGALRGDIDGHTDEGSNDSNGGSNDGRNGARNYGKNGGSKDARLNGCHDPNASNIDRETPCASQERKECNKKNYQGNNSMAQSTHLSSHLCDEADGCLPPNGDLFLYKNYCSILLNEEEASRMEAANGSTCESGKNGLNGLNGQNGKLDNLNDSAEEETKSTRGEILDQTAHFQIVNGENQEVMIFPHANDVSPPHCGALPREGLDPRLANGDNCAVTPCGNRKKRKRHIIKGEGRKPIGEGEPIMSPTAKPNVTGTGEHFTSAYIARDASEAGCSDTSSSDLYGSDTGSCDGRSHGPLHGDRSDDKFKRWIDSCLIHSMEESHPSFEQEESTCKNDTARKDNSKETLKYVNKCISKNDHFQRLTCGSGGNDNNSVHMPYNNVGCYPDGNCLTSGQPLLNGVASTREKSLIKTFHPVECKSIPQEQLVIDGIVNRAEPQHMGGGKDNSFISGEITRLVGFSHQMEKQFMYSSEETERGSPNVLDCSLRGDSGRGANQNESPNGVQDWTPNGITEERAAHHKGDLFLENKDTSDKNCLLYKDTLLRYMNECTCTGEEEKSVFLQFLRLTPEWVLLELDELEEMYHGYFRNKIESFYKSYLVKISSQNSSTLREVPEEGSCRSTSGIPPRRSEYIRELQLIFDKKLSTLWKCMIFPIDFLYILNYKIFRILKTMNKNKVKSAKQEKDKQFKCTLKGVNFVKYKSAWCFTYVDLDDKKKEKLFPINDYGFMEAKTLSILCRKSFVLHLTKMYTFLKNVLLRNKAESGGTITKLINPKSINNFIDYYKKYEEFLVCYGKIVYFNESKNVFLTSKNKRDPLNYVPFEIRHKMSGEIEPLNLITATRNYFSKKSQMIKFPKGIVYLSGYFLWVLLFLNHNNKEVIISFSARKYSFETAKAKCFQCYYFLLYKYRFRPINISGVVDLILETDLECKSYNLLDYEAEEIMPLDCLFHFFAPSNYVLQNGVIYKRLLLNRHVREGDLWREQYDSLFPNEYVSLDNFQTYEIEDDYLVAVNEVHGNLGPNASVEVPLNGYMNSEGEGYTEVNLLNDAEVAIGQRQYYSPFEFPSLRQDQRDCYPYNLIEHSEGNECPAPKHRHSGDDLLLYHDMEQAKKDIPLDFTDDENGKSIRLKRRDIYLGKSVKRGNYTNLDGSPEEVDAVHCEEYHLRTDNDGRSGSSGSSGSSSSNRSNGGDEKAARELGADQQQEQKEKERNHGTYDPSSQHNENFTMCRSERVGMTSWGMHLTCGNSNVRSLRGGQNIEEDHERGEDHPTVNAGNGRAPNGQVSSDSIERSNDEESDYHLEKKEQKKGGIIGQNLNTRECSNDEQSTQGGRQETFLKNAEYYYKDVWNKNIFHFFDNNIQDEYLKRNYNSLFNNEEEKNVVFKKIVEKEEHIGIFLMLNCQWLSDSFVHNINQIETKYADIYSFENYLNTREEVLNWKCEKNFIKDCADIAKKCPRVVGVHYDTHAHAWVVNCTSNGKRRDKKFLVKTFGFLQARKMAIAHREKWQQQRALHLARNVNGKGASRVETHQMGIND
ncbi:hypothetical protein C922_01915 [Plasmodium inui San Antonio 1]|uniref:AP2/ERF domain-containing protein n=1 Tax=Plasmodium inui San Antonio 1 TaxID=1237626 RepID=W7AQM6_9APIC|nr:hypothetical protein C922_01915 [Plasmodium inui San Antonio 1]EUD67726.1 hypothetical protein C922_01915 [Plasmodium inui San Antonio 1]